MTLTPTEKAAIRLAVLQMALSGTAEVARELWRRWLTKPASGGAELAQPAARDHRENIVPQGSPAIKSVAPTGQPATLR